MKASFILLLVLWPIISTAQWVQVGFVVPESVATPATVVVADENGSWQKELTLRNRYDLKHECFVSEPLVLPKHASEGSFAIRWEQNGLEFSYRFKPMLDQPLQVLLNQPTTKTSQAELKCEPILSLAPNPFNPTTTISLALPEASLLKLEIFDILGRQVSLLADEKRPSGTHQWVVDGTSWASGTYFLSYRLSPGQSGVRRLVLLK